MEAKAAIIDLRRASSRERTARSRVKQKDAKRAEKEAKRIAKRMIREREAIDLRRASSRERTARSRAKKKKAKNMIREREVEATTTPPLMTTTTMEAAAGACKRKTCSRPIETDAKRKAGDGIDLPITKTTGTTGASMATTPSATIATMMGAATGSAADGTTTTMGMMGASTATTPSATIATTMGAATGMAADRTTTTTGTWAPRRRRRRGGQRGQGRQSSPCRRGRRSPDQDGNGNHHSNMVHVHRSRHKKENTFLYYATLKLNFEVDRQPHRSSRGNGCQWHLWQAMVVFY